MKQEIKKAYATPVLNVYGAVSELTRNGGSPNSDVPNGPSGTAFSPAP